MQLPVVHLLKNNHFWVSGHRCLFWEEQRSLILSDLHFGKTGHFRKSGIAVPPKVFQEDLQRLADIVMHFNPAQIIAVGDFFHSSANKEIDQFARWRNDFASLHIQLIKGNHDILSQQVYDTLDITTIDDHWQLDQFVFTHDINDVDSIPEDQYIFSGHIHPAVTLYGAGKQSLRFPCFYFTPDYAVLPAFSRFTGTYGVNANDRDTIYAIVENAVIRM